MHSLRDLLSYFVELALITVVVGYPIGLFVRWARRRFPWLDQEHHPGDW